MKHAILAIIVTAAALSGCHRDNYAVDAVHAVDPKADCSSLYVNAGDQLEHSAVCSMSDQSVLYCKVATGSDDVKCDTLKQPPRAAPAAPPPAPAQPAAAAPSSSAPAVPPAPAPTPSPAPMPPPGH